MSEGPLYLLAAALLYKCSRCQGMSATPPSTLILQNVLMKWFLYSQFVYKLVHLIL